MCKAPITTTVPSPATESNVKDSKASKLGKTKQAANAKDLSIAARDNIIRNAITGEEKRLRSTYRVLSHEWQDTVGFLVFTGSLVALGLSSYFWHQGLYPTVAMIATNAVCFSLFHEIEHDLIHDLYWKNQRWAHHLAFSIMYMLMNTVSPWWRRYYHLRHHQYSGTKLDVEERLIGVGMPWSLKRLLVTFTPVFGGFTLHDAAKDDPEFSPLKTFMANFLSVTSAPVSLILYALASSGLAHAWLPAKAALAVQAMMPYTRVYNYCLVTAGLVRHFCMAFLSTYTHYYMDLPEEDVFYQSQILDHPIFLPLQFFSWNFGATHVIHHFIARQPFYIRQLVSPKALVVMKEMGVRANDFTSQFRNNTWHSTNGNENDLTKEQ